MTKKTINEIIPSALLKITKGFDQVKAALSGRKSVEAEVILHDERYLSGEWALPDYATEGSAAIDIRAALKETLVIRAGETKLVPSGLAIHLADPNLAGILLPRSGLGTKNGIVLGNLTGLIDSDYHGEMGIPLWNRNLTGEYLIEPGDRVAQYLIIPVVGIKLKPVKTFTVDSERSTKGFGSSGIK